MDCETGLTNSSVWDGFKMLLPLLLAVSLKSF